MAKQNKMPNKELMGADAHSQLVKRERRANNVWNKLRRNKTAMIGLVIVVFMILIAVFAPLIATHDPNAIKPSETYLGIGEKGHIFGTDEFGRDLFSRVVYGARISLIAAIGGTVVGGILGILLGLIAGYAGGVADAVIMRLMDGMLAFPFVLLAIILMTILGSGLQNVILAIGIGNVPTFARVVRGQVHIVKNEEYCNAGRVIGISNLRMLFCQYPSQYDFTYYCLCHSECGRRHYFRSYTEFLGTGYFTADGILGEYPESRKGLFKYGSPYCYHIRNIHLGHSAGI